MKNVLLSLAAGLLLTLGFASQSQAVTVPGCTAYGVGYPGAYIQKCGTANDIAQAASGVDNALSNAPGQTTTFKVGSSSVTLLTYFSSISTTNKYQGEFYVFENAQQWINWAKVYLPTSIQPSLTISDYYTVSGLTIFSNGYPIYSVVFANVTMNATTTVPNYVPNNTGAHELGHWMDQLFAPGVGESATSGGVSATSAYASELKVDFAQFNKYTACTTTTSPFGVFSNYADSTSRPGYGQPYYICNGNEGNGSALNTDYQSCTGSTANQCVLPIAWKYPFGSPTTGMKGSLRELFAEEYGGGQLLDGMTDADNSPDEVDQYFGTNYQHAFECTRNLIKFVVNNNKLPTSSTKPSTWPSECPTF